MSRSCLVIVSLLFLLISGCSSVQVTYDFDPGIDFAALHSYSWMEKKVADDRLAKNPLVKKRIVRSIDEYLQQRGYTRVAPEQADFLISIHAGTREKMRVINQPAMGSAYYGRGYYPRWSTGPYYNRIDVHYYTEGTLVVDIVDRRHNELIWRGLGTGILRKYRDQKDMQQEIDTYVTEILSHFPPGNEEKASGRQVEKNKE